MNNYFFGQKGGVTLAAVAAAAAAAPAVLNVLLSSPIMLAIEVSIVIAAASLHISTTT